MKSIKRNIALLMATVLSVSFPVQAYADYSGEETELIEEQNIEDTVSAALFSSRSVSGNSVSDNSVSDNSAEDDGLETIEENEEITAAISPDQTISYSFVPKSSGYYFVVTSDNVIKTIYDENDWYVWDYGPKNGNSYYHFQENRPYTITVTGKDTGEDTAFTLKIFRMTPDAEISAPGSIEPIIKSGENAYYKIHANQDLDAEVTVTFPANDAIHYPYMGLYSADDWTTRITEDVYAKSSEEKSCRHQMKAGEDYILEVYYTGESTLPECGITVNVEEFSSYPVKGDLKEGVFEKAYAGDAYSFVPHESGEYYLNRRYAMSSNAYGEIYDDSWHLLATCAMSESVPSVKMEAGKTYYIRIKDTDYSLWELTVERYHEPFFLNKLGDVTIETDEGYTIDATASAVGAFYKWERICEGEVSDAYESSPKYWMYGGSYINGDIIRITVTDVKGKTLTEEMKISVVDTETTSVKDKTSGVELVFAKREDGKASLIGFKGVLKGNVVIPDQVDGYPVTAIKDNVFIYGEGLTGIKIPDTVTSIGNGAFWGTSLKSLELPDSLKTIGESAFAGNSYLTMIDFPEQLESIGQRAFGECIGLRVLSFKNNLSLINYGAFQNSNGISDVYYEGTEAEWNQKVQIDKGSNSDLLSADFHFKGAMPEEKKSSAYRYIVKEDGTAAIIGYTGGAKANIPAKLDGYKVTEISGAAFAESAVTDVTIPDSVSAIGNGAFRNCTALKSVSLPGNLTALGREAFSGCKVLEEVSLPDSLQVVPEAAFHSCFALKNVKLPANLTEIGKEAFMNDVSLASVDFPQSLAKIDEHSFAYCSALTDVTIPEGVTYIPFEAFFGCGNLESLSLEGVEKIQKRAFDGCGKLTSVTFSNVLTTVHQGAFCADTALKDVYFLGTEAEWSKVNIAVDNDPLLNAQVHYVSTTPESITLNKKTITVKKGKSVKLTATVLPETAKNKNVLWSSADKKIATVDAKGTIKAIKVGETTITATTEDGGLKAVCKVTVTAPSVSGVTLDKSTLTLKRGESAKLTATVKPTDAGNKSVTWTSSNKKVATVDSKGNIKTLKVGTANITVKTADGGFTAVCKLTVEAPNVSGVKLDKETLTLKRGETGKLTATVEPADAANKSVTWTSSNKKVATVDSKGNIKTLKVGTANITVKTADGGFTAVCKLTVEAPNVSGVKLDKETLTLKRGETGKLTATVEPADAGNKSVTWTSSNKKVATVDSKGNIKTLKVGTANITVKTADGGFTAVCKLTVEAPNVSGVKLDKETLTLKRGETGKLTATVEPTDAANKSVTWTSSNKKVATVDSKGNIKTLKVGTANITVKTADGGFTAVCKLTVEAPNVSGVRLDKESASLVEGDTLQLTATVEPEDAGNKTLSWTSSNKKVVTVDGNGLVKAVKEGTAEITATTEDGGFKAVCKITIKKKVVFKDVKDKNLWYYDAVYWAVENGVTSGMGEGTFQPMANLSRAQTVMFLYKLAGQPDVSNLKVADFKDVAKSAWYYNAVKWAVANKITSGYGEGTFQPNVTCNRAMIATFLMRYSKLAGTYTAPTTSARFKDVPANAWYKEAIDWAVASGVTSGYGEGAFQPMVTCNRAMMVTFLKRVAEL